MNAVQISTILHALSLRMDECERNAECESENVMEYWMAQYHDAVSARRAIKKYVELVSVS